MFQAESFAWMYGVPIHGEINGSSMKALDIVARVTTKEEWVGVKGLYILHPSINGQKLATVGDSGVYLKLFGDGFVGLGYRPGKVYELGEKDSPLIAINLKPGYEGWMTQAFCLLHELSHHVNGSSEAEADKFAVERLARVGEFVEVKRSQKDYLKPKLTMIGSTSNDRPNWKYQLVAYLINFLVRVFGLESKPGKES